MKDYAIIFLLMEYPQDLKIAVRKDTGYFNYTIMTVDYGGDYIDEIAESSQFKEIELMELPESLNNIHEWKDRIKPNVGRAFIHKDLQEVRV